MSQVPSMFKVFGLVLLATWSSGLLFAQSNVSEEQAPPASPSDKKVDVDAKPEATPEAAVPAAKQPAVVTTAEPTLAADAPSAEADSQSEAETKATWQRVTTSLWVFVLAIFIGFAVITKVPPTLHTPLMSGSNAISGITLVGAVIVAASMSFSGFVGFLAVALATVNAVGGFMVTHRMLAMFKKR